MLCALVASSWKVLGLLNCRTYSKSHSIPWAHISIVEVRQIILALEAERSPTINGIEDRLILPLLRICQLCHSNSMLCTVVSIEELIIHFFPTIDQFGLQVGVPIESNTFKGSNELLREPIPFSSNVIAHFD